MRKTAAIPERRSAASTKARRSSGAAPPEPAPAKSKPPAAKRGATTAKAKSSPLAGGAAGGSTKKTARVAAGQTAGAPKAPSARNAAAPTSEPAAVTTGKQQARAGKPAATVAARKSATGSSGRAVAKATRSGAAPSMPDKTIAPPAKASAVKSAAAKTRASKERPAGSTGRADRAASSPAAARGTSASGKAARPNAVPKATPGKAKQRAVAKAVEVPASGPAGAGRKAPAGRRSGKSQPGPELPSAQDPGAPGEAAVLLHRPQVETPSVNARMLAEATARITARRARDMLPVRIATRRLVLRAPIRGDVPKLVKLADNPSISRWLSRLPSPYTRADAVAFVEIFAQRADERPFVITLDDALIGIVGFSFRDGRPPELGYWLGEPFWGGGYATEAVRGLIDAAHGTGLYGLIAARCLVDNLASAKVLEKAGFKKTGKIVEDHGGDRRTILMFELEAPRWT